jgi:hypothetical protein
MIIDDAHNLIETYTSGGSLFANITPNNHLMSYQTSDGKTRLCRHHRKGRSENRLAICLPRGRVDPAAICRRSRTSWNAPQQTGGHSPTLPRLRDDQGELRRLLGAEKGRRATL